MVKLDGIEKGSARRCNCQIVPTGNDGFGFYGEWRQSNGHFEHRTLSGMWMSHPVLATAVLGTARAIAKEIFKLGANNDYNMNYLFPREFYDTNVWHANFSKWNEIPLVRDMKCGTSSKVIKGMLHSSDPANINKEYLKKWYSKLKSMSTYNKHSKHIDTLFEILSHSTDELSTCGTNLKKNWLEGNKYLNL